MNRIAANPRAQNRAPADGQDHAGLIDDAHTVAFYDSEDFLVASVADFLRPAWRDHVPAAVILRAHLLRALADALAEEGVDVAAAERDGQLVLLDAEETLPGLLGEDGTVDTARFAAAADELMAPLLRDGRRPRVAGEMVALLWDRGDVAGAFELEQLWNDLAAAADFALFCPYPLRAFDGDDGASWFRQVCAHHTEVVPAESWAGDAAPAEQRRQVADIQRIAGSAVRERDRLRAEQDDLRAEIEQLHQQDHLRTEFVAMVAHDLQSPMAVVRGVLGLLRDHWGELDTAEADEFLARSQRSARQLERLVRDVLTVAQLEGGQFSFHRSAVDLGALADEVAADTMAATGRAVDVTYPPGLPPVEADEDRQRQVLANLLSNAIKFSTDGTPVEVSVEEADAHLVVAVTDHGIGIDEDQRAVLFRPFMRADARHYRTEGTGLGLYITRALVEGQGGTIEVDSTPGVGSTFTYTVPLAEIAGDG